MLYHLSFDGSQNNGIIFNDKYQGCLFEGVELKPTLSFEFNSFSYSEVWERQGNYIENSENKKRVMSESEEVEVRELAIKWVQQLGQEGNPTVAQKMEFIRFERDNLLKATDYLALTDQTLTEEMRSYRQALRDMTTNIDIDNPIYPIKP